MDLIGKIPACTGDIVFDGIGLLSERLKWANKYQVPSALKNLSMLYVSQNRQSGEILREIEASYLIQLHVFFFQ